ncbi:MAG: bile acid:sodium symporter [Desulfatiglandaceae bacterium]
MKHPLEIHIEHFVQKNLLLMGIFIALILSIHVPGPGKALDKLDLTGFLVALIFVGQGTELDFKQLIHAMKFLRVILWAVFLSLILFPFIAWVGAKVFSMPDATMVGFILICAAPCTLAAGPTVAARAGGDELTAIILIVFLNLLGLFTYPENLKVWLGAATHVDDVGLILKLIFYLFIPIIIGQVLRFSSPKLIRKGKTYFSYLPVICLSLIIYASCSAESVIMNELKLSEVLYILVPCLCVHYFIFGLSFFGGKYILKISDRVNRATTIICSEKPLTLSVAIWSMVFAHTFPKAIFPIIIFYIAELFTDSTWASISTRRMAVPS